MTNTQYKLNNTENAFNKMKKPFGLDDDFIDALKQAVIADIQANMPKSEKVLVIKFLSLLGRIEKFNDIKIWAGLMSSLFIKR